MDESELLALQSGLGLKSKEARIYLALLNHGAQLPHDLARVAGLKRTTLYNLFPEMLKAGIIYEVAEGKKRLLSATSPKKLFENFDERNRLIKKNISELIDLYSLQGLKPAIKIYEGWKGVQQIYLESIKTKGEILTVTRVSHMDRQMIRWFYEVYIPARIKRKTPIKSIAPYNLVAEKMMRSDLSKFRETRFVPEDKFPFKIDFTVYDDFTCFTICEKYKPIIGIVIQSREISATQRALFELAWEGAAKYIKRHQKNKVNS